MKILPYDSRSTKKKDIGMDAETKTTVFIPSTTWRDDINNIEINTDDHSLRLSTSNLAKSLLGYWRMEEAAIKDYSGKPVFSDRHLR